MTRLTNCNLFLCLNVGIKDTARANPEMDIHISVPRHPVVDIAAVINLTAEAAIVYQKALYAIATTTAATGGMNQIIAGSRTDCQ